ncbi:unnamed protein product [Paramecium octaurelia]|uniref:Ankyrin repeat-containing protein n=1 Tax=Paramecium octaurelia TaxID=43137 RepID=A0A8S1UQ45_PAROT|nr:unnamed protein product [Paramecium octaurelia]
MIREFLKDNTENCFDLMTMSENLDETDRKSGKSLLQIAITNHNLTLIKALLMKKADVNFQNKIDKSTPLFTSIQLNFLEAAQALLQTHQVNVEVEIESRTYLEHAVVIGSEQMIQLLIKYKVPIKENLLHLAINAEKDENAQFLIQNDIGLLNQDEDQENVLHILAFSGNAELLNAIIKRYINKPFQIDIWNQQNKEGNAPLHIAAINDKQLFLKLLLQNKDTINLDVSKLNRAGLSYQQIIENRKRKAELEQQKQQIRKRQIAQHRKERQDQRVKEIESQIIKDKEEDRIKKELKANKHILQKKEDTKNRLRMLAIFATIILGAYILFYSNIQNNMSIQI